MADVNIDRIAKELILDICKFEKQKKLSYDFTNYKFGEWKRLTRLMFINIPAIFVIEETYKIYEDISNDTWTDFKVPEIKTTKKEIDPSVQELSGKVDIVQVAKRYGLEVKKNRSKCVFHKGSNPTSLSFDIEKNIFNCFSCGTKGDIFTFVRLMEDLNNDGNKYKKRMGKT